MKLKWELENYVGEIIERKQYGTIKFTKLVPLLGKHKDIRIRHIWFKFWLLFYE